jgi:hypothetical protein
LVATEKFEDVDSHRTMLMELRSSGAQTVFPGSTHKETGEVIEDSEPLFIDGRQLRRQVMHLAGATILARHWPRGAGSRGCPRSRLDGSPHARREKDTRSLA